MRDAKNGPRDEWTLQKGIAPGTKLALCRHLVECIEIVHSETTYDVWRVRVLGPITMAADGTALAETVPELKWGAESFDMSAFTPQRAPARYR